MEKCMEKFLHPLFHNPASIILFVPALNCHLSTSSTGAATIIRRGLDMNKKLRYDLSSHLEELRNQYEKQSKQFQQLEEFSTRHLKARYRSNGYSYFYVFNPNKSKYSYLGTINSEEVCKIKKAHFLKLSTSSLQKEIKLIETFLNKSGDVDFEAINNKLSKVYRIAAPINHISESDLASKWKDNMEEYKATFPPFRPEELIHRTQDGQYVRSKGEALIYNYLLYLGVVFVYELPLVIRKGFKDSLLLPDFTILSEIDCKSVIYIEHQGKMDSNNYRNKFNESVYKYWSNNYIPERDVFFTFDLPNGGFDDSPIKSIVDRHIRPNHNS